MHRRSRTGRRPSNARKGPEAKTLDQGTPFSSRLPRTGERYATLAVCGFLLAAVFLYSAKRLSRGSLFSMTTSMCAGIHTLHAV